MVRIVSPYSVVRWRTPSRPPRQSPPRVLPLWSTSTTTWKSRSPPPGPAVRCWSKGCNDRSRSSSRASGRRSSRGPTSRRRRRSSTSSATRSRVTRSSARKASVECRVGSHVDRRSARRHVELRPRAAVRVRLGGAARSGRRRGRARSSSRSAASCSPRLAGVVRGSATVRITAEDGGVRLAVSSADSLARALVCTGLQSDDPDQIAAYGRRIVALYSTARGTRALGSPALCLAYVAAGRIDAFLRTRRHVRVGRRRGRAVDHRGRRSLRGPRRRTAQPRHRRRQRARLQRPHPRRARPTSSPPPTTRRPPEHLRSLSERCRRRPRCTVHAGAEIRPTN